MATKALMIGIYFLAQEPFITSQPQAIVDAKVCDNIKAEMAKQVVPLVSTIGGVAVTKHVIECNLVDRDELKGWQEQYDEGQALPY